MVKSYVLCRLVQPDDVAAVFGRFIESEPISATSRSTFFAGICAVSLGAAVALTQIEYVIVKGFVPFSFVFLAYRFYEVSILNIRLFNFEHIHEANHG